MGGASENEVGTRMMSVSVYVCLMYVCVCLWKYVSPLFLLLTTHLSILSYRIIPCAVNEFSFSPLSILFDSEILKYRCGMC